MIGLVLALVLSPWYSVYFNQSLKEQSLQNYRVSGSFARSSSTAELARIFHKPGLGMGVEIHADEQMALEAIARRTGHVKENLSKLRHHVDDIRKKHDTTSSIANIALLKLIRVELAAADLYLAQGAYPRAQALVTAATDDLKSQTAFFEEEPQRFNLQKIFDLTARINRAEGDAEGEARAQALRSMLADPAAASEWFRTHGMKGFSGSYPSEFLIKNLLSLGNKNSRVTALTQALEACTRPGVRPSTRTVVIQTAVNEGDELHAPALVTGAVNLWLKFFSNAPIQYKPEAMAAFSLSSKILQTGSPAQRVLIRSKMKECIDKNLLPEICVQTYFDSYESNQILSKLWPPSTPEAGRSTNKEIDDLLELCHKSGSDDFTLKMAKIVALNAFSSEQAAGLTYELLDRMPERTPEQSKIDQIRMINALSGVVDTLAKAHTAESKVRTLRFLERMKSGFNWEDRHKLRLLMSTYDSVPETDKARREKISNDVLALSKKLNLKGPETLQFTFFVLNNIMISQNRYDEGSKIMEDFRESCGSDISSVALLWQQLLGYRRAYPSYNQETLKISREQTFPAKYFEETPGLVAQLAGKRSARYCRCVLWLSQFEYCRGNYERALQLTNEVLATPGVERMDSYLAAKDMRTQILGEKPSRIEGEIIGAHDSNLELLCLNHIYLQLKKPDAAARVAEVMKHVRER